MPGLGRRRAAVCDVPDLALFPDRYAGVRTCTFHAGLELPSTQAGMAAIAWAVRLGLLRSGAVLARAAIRLAQAGNVIGGDRGAMVVDVSGHDAAGRHVRRRWTLFAGSGHGPFIPAMPAVIVARKMLAGAVPPGARACLGAFTPAEFLAEVADLDIAAATTETIDPLAGTGIPADAAARLAGPLRAVRCGGAGDATAGQADLLVTGSAPGRLAARLAGFPRTATAIPFAFRRAPAGDGEVWTRHFGADRFRSTLMPDRGDPACFTERVGPLCFRFRLDIAAERIIWQHLGTRLAGLPLPRRLAPRIAAHERADGSLYRFDVAATFPFGLATISYRGWLETDPSRNFADSAASGAKQTERLPNQR
ncbi:MAG: DUF4166 domain-containing protein [Alphaproteobacteria bacterium]